MDASSYGLSQAEMMQMVNLWKAEPEDLENVAIRDWFDDDFFHTVFWYAYEATLAFQPWSSVERFKR